MTREEIQVGEYVRTKDGTIDKIKRLDCIILNKDITGEKHLYSYIDIVNHSFNLIDLIKVGDYVNGHLVVGFNEKVDINGYKYKEIEIESDYLINHHLKLEDIKSIVTHKQFGAMKYKVGEEDD